MEAPQGEITGQGSPPPGSRKKVSDVAGWGMGTAHFCPGQPPGAWWEAVRWQMLGSVGVLKGVKLEHSHWCPWSCGQRWTLSDLRPGVLRLLPHLGHSRPGRLCRRYPAALSFVCPRRGRHSGCHWGPRYTTRKWGSLFPFLALLRYRECPKLSWITLVRKDIPACDSMGKKHSV